MLRHSLKKKREPRRRRIKKMRSLHIKKQEIKRSTKLNLRLKELKMRRREKSKDSENFKKKLLIDKPKSMPLGPRELLRKVRDKLGREKD
jgi:hypothetical protein